MCLMDLDTNEEIADVSLESDCDDEVVTKRVYHFEYSDDESLKTVNPKQDVSKLTSLDSKIVQKRKRLRDDAMSKEGTEVEDELKVKEKYSTRKKSKLDEEEVKEPQIEEKVKIEYGDVIDNGGDRSNFDEFYLCKPLMRALCKMDWNKPTPIQSAAIPVSLMGKDVCACAATGTGKTGAFMIPIIERLCHQLYEPVPTTKVLVLTPTRELAIQIAEVTKSLTEFTKITYALATGGLSRNSQEASLRLGPDIVIATLGRLIDHLHNAPNFNLSTIKILVLDEADRMLDEYFAEQMKEVIQRCSATRQTLLFSATMTEKVEDLALLSLKAPTKIFVNANQEVTLNLEQEFVKIGTKHEGKREAVIAALVKRTFKTKCLVFVQTKKDAHRLHIILGLLDVKVAEFHGNLSQTERLEALEKFKSGDIDVLLATDLMGRGIDIDDVDTVINMTLPPSLERYIHRVGRTARAGKKGRSVSLVGENERKMLKAISTASKVPLKHRIISKDILEKFHDAIFKLEKEVKEIEIEEEEEKAAKFAESKIKKAEKLLTGKKDDRKRGWFQSHGERLKEKENLIKKTKADLSKGILK